jgi:hypothetical protein
VILEEVGRFERHWLLQRCEGLSAMATGQLFSRSTQALFYNYKQSPVQRMLDFDFLCGMLPLRLHFTSWFIFSAIVDILRFYRRTYSNIRSIIWSSPSEIACCML